jgi:hypothetical protein
MSQKILGINVRSVDTTAKHELGMEVMDVEGGEGTVTKSYYPNGQQTLVTETLYKSGSKVYKYVRADAAIAQYDACKMKLDETDAPNAVVKTAATTDLVKGICEVSGVSADYYFWLTIHGYVPIANVADASAQGEILGASGTAGRLETPTFTTTAATLAQLNAGVRAAISGIVAVTDGSASNLAGVFINGR